MNITADQLAAAITPLLLGLHEKGILDIAEVPYFYEDAVMRRKYNLQESDEALAFQREWAKGLHRLAELVKKQGSQPT